MYFRVKECKISEISGDRTVYPVHSFGPDGTCFDPRLAVQQTLAPPNIEIAFRSFRFRTDSVTNNNQVQEQLVSCQLHLDSVASMSNGSNQPQTASYCSCYSPCECGVLPGYTFDTALSSCVDIDECQSDADVCPLNSDCVNTDGSYECFSTETGGSGDTCDNIVNMQFALQYNHQLVFDDLDIYDYVHIKILDSENFDYLINIGIQSTAYTGPNVRPNDQWNIVIGGGIENLRWRFHFFQFAAVAGGHLQSSISPNR